MDILSPRHIQDHAANTTEEKYWGYASRVVPCTKDAGTCEYLDGVYGMHVTSMLYTFILWAVIGGVLLLWAALRFRFMGMAVQGRGSGSKFAAWKRALLPDAPMRWLFGRVSRLQVVVLGVMLGYLAVFSLIGIVYKTWITPIAGSSLFNTRTGLGGWSDRIGALAYALTPLTILFCMRESVLSLITGIPYQHFNFLHRWLGRIIFVQSFLHTLVWTLIEGKFYQPQPKIYVDFMAQMYIIFGVVAMALITFLTIFSTPAAIRWTGYEFFKITHGVVAVLYIAACWGHWDRLWCWMVPSLVLMALDQAVRLLRVGYVHYTGGRKGSGFGFKCAEAEVKVLTDDNGTVIRLDVEHEHRQPWQAGQHFYLTFPSLSIWQAHPFTVASLPEPKGSYHRHTYLIRVRDGQTSKLAQFDGMTVPVIFAGPYGKAFPSYESQHVLAVSGGTGVTFTLPILLAALRQSRSRAAVFDFVWVVRKSADLLWLGRELHQLKQSLAEHLGLRIQIFVSRDSGREAAQENLEKTDAISEEKTTKEPATTVTSIESEISLKTLVAANNARFNIHFLGDHHPSLKEVVQVFRERSANIGGAVEIVGSGPEAMGSDLRGAVAKVAEGDGVNFYWDSRE